MGYEQERGSARQRGYNARWQKASATFLSRHPHCLGCQALGRTVKAELVDHVEPHKGDPNKFWNTALWQPACRWHHDTIKQVLERRYLEGEIAPAELWLNSATAVRLSKQRPKPQPIGADGWLAN